uniref:hypothetical protein n=1 Tax=uncultured Microscilla sp. TaxID=432653 RepID=UPI0026035E53
MNIIEVYSDKIIFINAMSFSNRRIDISIDDIEYIEIKSPPKVIIADIYYKNTFCIKSSDDNLNDHYEAKYVLIIY